MFDRVFDFNLNVLRLEVPEKPQALNKSQKEWLSSVLREEISELEVADTIVDEVDALLDLCVFAIGGLARAGLSKEQAEACFNAIMDANFKKKAGTVNRRAVKGVVDAVKPEGWEPPEKAIKEILEDEQRGETQQSLAFDPQVNQGTRV